MNPDDEMLKKWSVPEVARHLGRTESLVRQLIRDGKLRAATSSNEGQGVGRGAKARYEVQRNELVRYCEAHGYAEPGATPPPASRERPQARSALAQDAEPAGSERDGFDDALLRELHQAERALLQERIARLEVELEARENENTRLRGLVRDLSQAVSRSVEEPNRAL
jgi:hypothetical protein